MALARQWRHNASDAVVAEGAGKAVWEGRLSGWGAGMWFSHPFS